MMNSENLLSKIKGVNIVKPSDHVVQQFRTLISNGDLKPGDVLPSERELASSFGIGRGYIREAIKTLELYGIVKSVPGVGTIVGDLGVSCINEFLNNLVQFGVHDYVELVEVRKLIEPFTAQKAALNATDEELDNIKQILDAIDEEIANGRTNLQLECDFHLEIARASHNRILVNTISAILPGLLQLLDELDLARGNRIGQSNVEHHLVYEALARRDPKAAEKAMTLHMKNIRTHFSDRIPEIAQAKRSKDQQP